MSNPRTLVVNTNRFTIIFMVVLSLLCALILSILASVLQKPQEQARELDRYKQLLIAANILTPEGTFVNSADGKGVASGKEILNLFNNRVQAFLVDDKGNEKTFAEAGLSQESYLSEFRKSGYYRQPQKLVYRILDHDGKKTAGYAIPINGMGLWDAIYGFLAFKPDGDTVIGSVWYDQKETPGLGANIAEAEWQSQFPGKRLFQEGANGHTDFHTATLGLTVIKGKVKELYGDSPKALSSLDGMAGATLTGNGVTNAYKDVLAAYRPFLVRLHEGKEQ